MPYDDVKLEEAAPALLGVFEFENGRAWTRIDFDVMDGSSEGLHHGEFRLDALRRECRPIAPAYLPEGTPRECVRAYFASFIRVEAPTTSLQGVVAELWVALTGRFHAWKVWRPLCLVT